MAALGSDVQSTSVELVSVIERMKERKTWLDEQISTEEAEQERVLAEMRSMQARLALLKESLAKKHAVRAELERTITETYSAFKNILDASKKLLSTAKEESSALKAQID
ncbi:sjogren s syndrome nuclear autoantigen 1 [Novymonas esmeraldas]|uniref:Sjogren s syndrome nuclear autoantigen 1 n=1 Tax=Novymonas esmeraldas TaxID=1808958 RepID=A0AAW0EUE3_9TRYP